MAIKKQNKNGSNVLFFLFAAVAVFFIILLIMAMSGGDQELKWPPSEREMPNLSVMETSRSLEVLAINQDNYATRDINSHEPVSVIIPESALVQFLNGPIIKAGDIFVLQAYVAAANGLVAQKMQVLPPAPGGRPSASLPNNPNE